MCLMKKCLSYNMDDMNSHHTCYEKKYLNNIYASSEDPDYPTHPYNIIYKLFDPVLGIADAESLKCL